MEKIKIDVDSLIINYMIYKAENGYDLSFTYQEFMDFVKSSEEMLDVTQFVDNPDILFKKFFERKNDNGWHFYSSQRFRPHIDLKYDANLHDHVLKANYNFSHYDTSIIDTYHWGEYKLLYLKDIISLYLDKFPKRKLNNSYPITDYEKDMAKGASALILSSVWNNYINEEIELGAWPRQCRDINKYLFDIDLASIIDVKSINDELLALYQDFSERIASLYHDDKNLKIGSYSNNYLKRSNYDIITDGYQDLMNIGPYGKAINIDFDKLSFVEDYYKNPKVIDEKLDSDKVKKLVKNIESKIN